MLANSLTHDNVFAPTLCEGTLQVCILSTNGRILDEETQTIINELIEEGVQRCRAIFGYGDLSTQAKQIARVLDSICNAIEDAIEKPHMVNVMIWWREASHDRSNQLQLAENNDKLYWSHPNSIPNFKNKSGIDQGITYCSLWINKMENCGTDFINFNVNRSILILRDAVRRMGSKFSSAASILNNYHQKVLFSCNVLGEQRQSPTGTAKNRNENNLFSVSRSNWLARKKQMCRVAHVLFFVNECEAERTRQNRSVSQFLNNHVRHDVILNSTERRMTMITTMSK